MNRAQYEHGAMLVVPNEHHESILELAPALLSEVHQTVQQLAETVVPLFGATGLGVFQNNGVSAGQTVAHYHVHVVPRYPSSDPGRRFREADFPHSPHEELERVAALIRAAVEAA
jgi:histidine triad (HIT) family protein